MNVDTDTQYAFTRPIAEWMMRNFDGVLKIDGEVGNKKQYDPRAWGKAACLLYTSRPTLNSRESPGRIGNSSPHSMKTMAALTQKNWVPN